MIRARGQLPASNADFDATDDEDVQIPWLETDPRRAPLRNDLVTALQVAFCPAVFWFIFFTGYYPIRGAFGATVVMTLITFGTAFVLTWARMATARRKRATTRSARSKMRVAAVVGGVIGLMTFYTSGTAYPETTTALLLAAAAGLAAAVVLLTLESYAVSVPAVERSLPRSPRMDEF